MYLNYWFLYSVCELWMTTHSRTVGGGMHLEHLFADRYNNIEYEERIRKRHINAGEKYDSYS